MATSKASRPSDSKIVVEFNVMDDATKKRIAQCIERRGKVTVTLVHKAKTTGVKNGNGGFEQFID
jgi:ribosomal protein L23